MAAVLLAAFWGPVLIGWTLPRRERGSRTRIGALGLVGFVLAILAISGLLLGRSTSPLGIAP